MGATEDKGKKPRKKRRRSPKEPLSEEQKELLAEVGNAVDDALHAIEKAGQISREFSLVRTRLEESEMWLDRGFEAMGYAPVEDEAYDEDDDEDDEGDPRGDEEE